MLSFNEEEVHILGREVARLQQVTTEQASACSKVLPDVGGARLWLKGGVDYARKMLVSAFGPDQARTCERLMKTISSDQLRAQKADHNNSPVHPQRASANDRLILSHESVASGGAVVLAAGGDASRRRVTNGAPGPDLAGYHCAIATIIGQKLTLGELNRESMAITPWPKYSTGWTPARARRS